jgi:hypothetical protein
MRIVDWRHVPEPALAEVADEPAARQRLSPSDRHHLDTCDRCRALLDGHRRAAQLVVAPWGFVTADQMTGASGIQRVRGVVSVGDAAVPIRLPAPIWAALALLLLSALIGTGLMVGVIRPPDEPPPAVYAGPSDAATPTPTPSPSPNLLDTSTWRSFTSARYGLEMAYPARWTVESASQPWNLVTDQISGVFLSSTDRFFAPKLSATFAAYGMALPEGMPYEAFIADYRAPNVAARGVGCFPPPSLWERITIDGHDAGLVSGCDYLEAMLLADGHVYIFSGYSALAIDRPMFDAFLSTIRLYPAAAADPPVGPSPSPR